MREVLIRPKLLLTRARLNAVAFERSVTSLNDAWNARQSMHHSDAWERLRQPGGRHENPAGSRCAKIFLLFYLECLPLQEVMTPLFDLDQNLASHYVDELTPLVITTVGRTSLLPARRFADLETLCCVVSELRRGSSSEPNDPTPIQDQQYSQDWLR